MRLPLSSRGLAVYDADLERVAICESSVDAEEFARMANARPLMLEVADDIKHDYAALARDIRAFLSGRLGR